MTLRLLLASLVLLLGLPTAQAAAFGFGDDDRVEAPNLARMGAAVVPEPHPLTGEGENFEIVGNLPLDTSDVAASDIEMHGDHAYIGSYSEGLVIADISDPRNPRRAGTFKCGGGSQYDVQLSSDASIAVLSTDSSGASCLPEGKQGSMIVDVSDKANPRLLSFIEISAGTHTQTLDDRTLYINNYPTSYSKLEIYDLTDAADPAKVSELSFGGEDSVHDSFVDHRSDGRSLLYAASIGYTDVIDVTDLSKPTLLQRLADPAVTISHQAEPNPARDTLVVTDEFLGGTDAPFCGKVPISPGEGIRVDNPLLPTGGDPSDVGAIHFYKLAADGTMVNNGEGDGKIGTYNLPPQMNSAGGCTVHVLWQAPDENRLVAAWYGRGTHIVDFSDPANPVSRGRFLPAGGNTWAAKPHRGYIFTGDITRGMDVLRYTGEDGGRWPATAGPQEDQRAAYRRRPGTKPGPVGGGTGTPDVAPAPAPASAPQGGTPANTPASRVLGTARFSKRVRLPGRRGRKGLVTVTFRDAKGAVVAKLRHRIARGRAVRVRAAVSGVVGRYTYQVRRGDRGRTLRRGAITVRRGSAAVRLAPDRTLVCRLL